MRLRHQRLAEELARRPLTLNRWAQRLGLASGHLSELVNGKRRYPTGRTRDKLLRGLELEFDELFEIVERGDVGDAGGGRQRPPEPGRTPAAWDLGATAPVPRRRALPDRRFTRPKESDMGLLLQDLRHALRLLVRRPVFTVAAVLTLGIGVGANLGLFSLLNAVLLRPYPYHEPERLVDVRPTFTREGGGTSVSNFSWLDYLDTAERAAGVIDLAAWDWEPFSLAGGDRPVRVAGGQVTANFLDVLGATPLLGRFFTESERAGDQQLVVLGESIWRNHFGADPGIVGRVVEMNGAPATVVGVLPATVSHPDAATLWVPLRASSAPESRGAHWLRAVGRPAPGVDREAAIGRLSAIAEQLAQEHPDHDEGMGMRVIPLRESEVGEAESLFWVLQGVALVVLLIVCANVASLLLSRSTERRGELAVRAALGAGRRRLTVQLLIETAVLALLGVALGVPLGLAALRGARALIPVELPAWFDPSPDARVALYTVAVAVAMVLLCGLAPALRGSRMLSASLRRDAASGVGAGRLRAALVVAQVALCAVLLVGAALMVRSFSALGGVDPGFDPAGKLVIGLDLLALRSLPPAAREPELERVYDAVAAVPGVEAVGAIDRIPLGGSTNSVGVQARDSVLGEEWVSAIHSRVTPGYIDAVGLPLLEGEDFPAFGEAGGEREAVISRLLAERAWPGESPLGREVGLWQGAGQEPAWYRVRGVVGDVRHLGLARESMPGIYVTENSRALTRSTWVIRSDQLGAEELAAAVREAVARVQPNQPLHDVMALEQFVARSLWNQRFFAVLFSVFTGVAVLLAAVGLYGLLSYTVALRRHEVGVRMALGAGRRQVARMFVRQSLRLVGLGLLLGLPAALLVGRGLAGLLYGVGPIDVPSLVLCPLLLLVVAAVATAWPARRAAAADPVTTLRLE
ncbi:MAG TPA: ADOP family duplicated permease [Thermoanaerobaculia bacterium]|nr:ADOP family duplicated permease [Thermoanaerobaculia bacterium]